MATNVERRTRTHPQIEYIESSPRPLEPLCFRKPSSSHNVPYIEYRPGTRLALASSLVGGETGHRALFMNKTKTTDAEQSIRHFEAMVEAGRSGRGQGLGRKQKS